jgi:3-mercaptopyruvate sulfurtransferase SseA
VLNGGLIGWSAAGGALETATPPEREQTPAVYPEPSLDEGVIRSERLCKSVRLGATLNSVSLGYAQMYDNSGRSGDTSELVLDARSEGR